MKHDDDDLVDDLIAYKIIMEDEKKINRKGSSGGCLSWVLVIIGIVLAVSAFGSCSGNSKKSSYSEVTRQTAAQDICRKIGCHYSRLPNGDYCYLHTCLVPGCYDKKAEGSNYCAKHKTYSTTSSTTAAKVPTRSTGKKEPYNISSYSNVDDFYDDWYDDFDGFDNAEMYWDEHH